MNSMFNSCKVLTEKAVPAKLVPPCLAFRRHSSTETTSLPTELGLSPTFNKCTLIKCVVRTGRYAPSCSRHPVLSTVPRPAPHVKRPRFRAAQPASSCHIRVSFIQAGKRHAQNRHSKCATTSTGRRGRAGERRLSAHVACFAIGWLAPFDWFDDWIATPLSRCSLTVNCRISKSGICHTI